ncbi:unnamed protein product, partial [Brenthis ino]
MVCEGRCGCGAFCRRLFCRARPPESCDNEEAIPITSTQLAEARDVKFTQNLTEPLSIGSHIICTGTPTDDLPWFAINIGCGDSESGRADIAIHFNVRLPQCYVVRNTKRHDKWGSEETTAFRLFPFKADRLFLIEILVDEKETLWAVDGEHYCSYAHRNPSVLDAQWIQVTGVRDAALKIQKTDIYPTLAPPTIEVPMRSCLSGVAENEPSWRPNVMAALPIGIPDGHQIVIYGRLRPLLHSFALDLLDKPQEWPRSNVLVHVNVRAHADAQLARQLVVLNAWLGAWGAERRQRSAKLVPGTKTTFRIVRGATEWSVFADDLLIGEMEFRAAPAGVRALRVRGDLYPEQIYLCPSSSSPQDNVKCTP